MIETFHYFYKATITQYPLSSGFSFISRHAASLSHDERKSHCKLVALYMCRGFPLFLFSNLLYFLTKLAIRTEKEIRWRDVLHFLDPHRV